MIRSLFRTPKSAVYGCPSATTDEQLYDTLSYSIQISVLDPPSTEDQNATSTGNIESSSMNSSSASRKSSGGFPRDKKSEADAPTERTESTASVSIGGSGAGVGGGITASARGIYRR